MFILCRPDAAKNEFPLNAFESKRCIVRRNLYQNRTELALSDARACGAPVSLYMEIDCVVSAYSTRNVVKLRSSYPIRLSDTDEL